MWKFAGRHVRQCTIGKGSRWDNSLSRQSTALVLTKEAVDSWYGE